MADIGGTIGTMTSSLGNSTFLMVWILVIALAVLSVLGLVFFFLWNKKQWNLRVEIKLPRSDGKFIQGEWAKGKYVAKRGIVFIKRKKIYRKFPMKAFDVKKYLQGTDLLTVVQITPEHYIPVNPKSYLHLINDKDGAEIAVLKLHSDVSESKQWKNYFERESKSAFSIQSIFTQYQVPIAIGLVLLFNFVGFAVVWGRLPSICTGGG